MKALGDASMVGIDGLTDVQIKQAIDLLRLIDFHNNIFELSCNGDILCSKDSNGETGYNLTMKGKAAVEKTVCTVTTETDILEKSKKIAFEDVQQAKSEYNKLISSWKRSTITLK
jgi:hypothetical protein